MVPGLLNEEVDRKKLEECPMKRNNLFHNTVRALPIAACAIAVGFAAACGSKDNSAAIHQTPVAANPDLATSQNLWKVDSSTPENQDLIGRVLGMSALVKPMDAPTGADPSKKYFDARVSFLVSDSSGQSAIQVVAEGAVYPGQEKDENNVKVDAKGKKHFQTRILLSETDSSPEAKGMYRVKAICGNDDCSLIRVKLSELIAKTDSAAAAATPPTASNETAPTDATSEAGSDGTEASTTKEAKPAVRQTFATFQRKAGASVDEPLELILSAGRVDATSNAVDTRSGKAMNGKPTQHEGTRTSFELAKKNFKGVVSPSAKETPAAPAAAPVAAPVAAPPTGDTTLAAPATGDATVAPVEQAAPAAAVPETSSAVAPTGAPAVANETADQSKTATLAAPAPEQK
jgi:hypothetical protein